MMPSKTMELMLTRFESKLNRAPRPKIDFYASSSMGPNARGDNLEFSSGVDTVLEQLDSELDTLLLSLRAKKAHTTAFGYAEDAQQEIRDARRYLAQLADYLENGNDAL
ncbi:hypothetical protein TIN2_101 [Tsukamurella phage TIN2]|uniref:Uncharacterized protein n=1 Tax=Tsukamurella phage TIN2 TaxID=1636545 RepID=A0A0K0N5C6_9CAUD|nr:hypothetical protein AVT55_gp022 [Tsukamurella phage TIN2]AKJ71791.1 hypothetical protein TIN2_101 [Tsukamurella phage TIN2]